MSDLTRILEPSIKSHLALWLVTQGATDIRISVDGAEPHASVVKSILTEAGYSHHADHHSKADWTGEYKSSACKITVVSQPGIDIETTLPGIGDWVAECKGEPTDKGSKAGQDRVSFYTAIGQLLLTVGSRKELPAVRAVGLPDTKRMANLVRDCSDNALLKCVGIKFLLVDKEGGVTEF